MIRLTDSFELIIELFEWTEFENSINLITNKSFRSLVFLGTGWTDSKIQELDLITLHQRELVKILSILFVNNDLNVSLLLTKNVYIPHFCSFFFIHFHYIQKSDQDIYILN